VAVKGPIVRMRASGVRTIEPARSTPAALLFPSLSLLPTPDLTTPTMCYFKRVVFAVCLSSALAFAQNSLVAITCDARSQAVCTYTDAGGTQHNQYVTDVNGDGSVEFTVPAGTATVTIRKYSDGRWITYDMKVSDTN
jgi:hypothetical protein